MQTRGAAALTRHRLAPQGRCGRCQVTASGPSRRAGTLEQGCEQGEGCHCVELSTPFPIPHSWGMPPGWRVACRQIDPTPLSAVPILPVWASRPMPFLVPRTSRLRYPLSLSPNFHEGCTMLIKSALATQMSGSIGGLTASRSKSGAYFRARSVPVNPNSTAQQLARSAMTELVTAWIETLTQAQRDAWADYAANVTVTNRLGDAINVSGQNMYVRCNQPRILAGLTRVDDAPVVFDGAMLDPVSMEVTGTDVEITFDDTPDWTSDPDAGLIVQTSRPQNPTKNFFKGPFRFAELVVGDVTTPPTSPAVVSSPFATPEDTKIFARVRLSLADGRISAPQIVSAIATV